MKEDITETLEAMIDRHGIIHIATAIELICNEKASHIETNWQDKKLAKKWDKAATRFRAVARWLDENRYL
jgi:hypothetical protein